MNQTLAFFARQNIKKGLDKLGGEHRKLFKRMYSPNDSNKNIEAIVDAMPDEQLDRALTQIENTLIKFKKDE